MHMKTYYYYLMACCCAATLLACEKKEPTEEPKMTVTPMELTFAASENEPQIIQVETNVEWQYQTTESATWMTVTEVGEGLSVAVTDNVAETDREATIKIMPMAAGLSIQTVTVSQLATDFSTYEITVAEEDRNIVFEGVDNEPRTIEVAVTGNLPWTATIDEMSVGWLSVKTTRNSLEISAQDNEGLEPRTGTVTLTTLQDFGIEPVTITVQQEAMPMFSIAQTSVELLPYGGMDSQATIVILTNMGEWDAVISSTADGTGPAVDWLKINYLDKEYDSVMIEAEENMSEEARSAFVVVTLQSGEAEPIAVTVVQKGQNTEAISTLTGPVNFTDMESGANNYVYFTPTYPSGSWFGPYESAVWEIDLWASTVEQYKESYYTNYRGQGTRLRLSLRSDKIMHNEEGIYVLPEGAYTIDAGSAEESSDRPRIIAPGEASYGGDTTMRYPVGSWYMELDGDNTYAETAPLTGGEMTVEYDEATGEYRLIFNFTDDRDNAITGTVVTKLDNLVENYTDLE